MDSTPQPRPTRRRLWGLFPAIWLVFLVNPTLDAFHKGGMTVADDGRGAKPTGVGSGLAGLNERAETFGAVVTTDSSMRGFVLRVSSAAPQEAMA